ncbi:tropomyosin-1 isoform X2 [Xenopus laevis]|uniref:Tropomyosin-1 isoform X2 n=1 Tax=Xenopus laevis TaxID=8355 RepID=A0A8J0TVK1_XENLA|nr:tropomyosin-1 isoform X2 [Xenopus laevis]
MVMEQIFSKMRLLSPESLHGLWASMIMIVPGLLAFILIFRYCCRKRPIKNINDEYEELVQQVASLLLEKKQWEEEATQLIEHNHNLQQSNIRLRKRNLEDADEENNQLFHDVALLSLENKQYEEQNKKSKEEIKKLLQTLGEIRGGTNKSSSDENKLLLQGYGALLEENENLKLRNMRLAEHVNWLSHPNRGTQQKDCNVS